MKNFIRLIFISTSIFIFIGCNKNQSQIKESKTSMLTQAATAAMLPADANNEVVRIFNDVQENDYVFGIIANPNFGISKSRDILLSGKTPSNIQLSINGINFSNQEGSWLQNNPAFESFYGSMVQVRVQKGNAVFVKPMYIPKMITCPKLCNEYQYINRNGNTLTWQVDQQNPMNKVAISYELYESDDVFSELAPYEKNIILVDNNGSFNIDNIISNPQCRRINFMIVSGNAFSFSVDQQKYLFDLFSADHHDYLIQ